ncbi:MAG: LysM peptidoglycan-binding domain-containing protein [Gammaproteobacteria bacterium]|nr:MAG: LysM peptidoglycan-binding domain-containing protein [Gammaproteobacteria bacterium]
MAMTAKRFFAGALGLLTVGVLSIGTVIADTLAVKGDAPETYTVVKGDTLWDISGKYLEKPWRWPELWEGNPQIINPHLIYPGDVISLYYVDGEPRLGINRSHRMKLKPKIRATHIDDAISVVPVEAIKQFLTQLKVADKASMDDAPYVVGATQDRVVAGAGDRVYVKGLENSDNDEYQIYHLGDPITDPVTGNVIAYEVIFVADAQASAYGDPATLLLTYSSRETKKGDRIMPSKTDEVLTDFYPTVPQDDLNGQVLNILDGVAQYGRFQAVIVNLGKQHGVDRGHVFSVFNKGEVIEDIVTADPKDTVKLPDERAGTVMVIAAYEEMSYALVMESRLPMRLLDVVKTPK